MKILKGVVGAATSIDRKSKPAVLAKVSPDEFGEEQVSSICQAVWASGAQGVVVGNTTKQRPKHPRSSLSKTEATIMQEHGGYSGPHLFDRTLELVKKYRRHLDQPLIEAQQQAQNNAQLEQRIRASVERDEQSLKPTSENSIEQPLIRLPERHSSANNVRGTAAALSASHHLEHSSMSGVADSQQADSLVPKVIFCTGGITDGHQALQVLEAGASVAMIYTGINFLTLSTRLLTLNPALVYSGVGKITSMKQEMRQEMRKRLDSLGPTQ